MTTSNFSKAIIVSTTLAFAGCSTESADRFRGSKNQQGTLGIATYGEQEIKAAECPNVEALIEAELAYEDSPNVPSGERHEELSLIEDIKKDIKEDITKEEFKKEDLALDVCLPYYKEMKVKLRAKKNAEKQKAETTVESAETTVTTVTAVEGAETTVERPETREQRQESSPQRSR